MAFLLFILAEKFPQREIQAFTELQNLENLTSVSLANLARKQDLSAKREVNRKWPKKKKKKKQNMKIDLKERS